MQLISTFQNFYGRFERPISSISLIGGFIFDIFALKRLDLFWENFWVVVHLLIVATCIILINYKENEKISSSERQANEQDPTKSHFWYVNIMQFFFGGILSTFLVFYFRSATLSVTWPFLLILAGAFIANERLKRHYSRLTFQISFLFLSLISYLAFIMPVFFHRIGADVFVISGISSLVIIGLFLLLVKFISKEKFKKSRIKIWSSVLGIFIVTNVLYFYNLIPPIPISLKDAGVYHSIVRDSSLNYDVTYEDNGWLGYFSPQQDFHIVAGDSAYAYSAIFSPDLFNIDITDEWQKYDDVSGQWITKNTVDLFAIGGRDGGYRTFSVMKNIEQGQWRVNVKTGNQIIGQLKFNVIIVDTEPVLNTEIKD